MLTHRIVAYLIALAVGYWVMTLAEKEKDHVKTIGKVIAWIIIVISLVGPACMLTSAVCHHVCGTACCSDGSSADGCHHSFGGPGMMGQCPMEGNKMMPMGKEEPPAKNITDKDKKEKTDK